MVEAAIVIPLLILMLLSMLMVLLYFYRAEQEQSAAHIALTEASIADNRMQKRIRRCYVLNPADGVRMGDLFHEKDE